MKQFLNLTILLMLSVSLFISCSKKSNPAEPIIPDDTTATYTPSDSARAHFLLDATDFAVNYLFEIKSPDTAKVIVPGHIVNKWLYPLACLYEKRHEIPILDTLIIQKGVHKQTVTSYSLFIKADTTFEWVQNVKKGICPTGNATVDSLVQLYHLSFGSVLLWGYEGCTWFATDQSPMNNYALGRAFLSAPGVVFTEPNWYWATYTKLDVIPTTSETIIHLYYGYGDCPAGCEGYERWSFSVSTDFQVTYLGYLLQ